MARLIEAPSDVTDECRVRPGHRWEFRKVILLSLVCLVVYNANLRSIGAGDTMAARYQPLGLWRFGTLRLDPIARWVAHGHPSTADWERLPQARVSFSPEAYWIVRSTDHHLVSLYPVVAPLLVSPLYLPAVLYLHWRGWKQPAVDRIAEWMEKLSASILATLAVVIIYLILRREGNRWDLPLALAFAFGTNTWGISSEALWQHGSGELLVALALFLAISQPTIFRAVTLGLVCGLIAANRPPDAALGGAILAYAVITRRNFSWGLLFGASISVGALLCYNLGVVGDMAGGYARICRLTSSLFSHSFGSGLAGLFVSPARGLLMFTPFLAFVPMGWWMRLRNPQTRLLTLTLSIAVIAQVLGYARMDWRAGASWGPRYLTDMLPVLLWMLAPAPLLFRSLGRIAFILTVMASVAIQAIGAFWYTGVSDRRILGSGPLSLRAAWDFDNIPFVTELRHERARGDLLCNASAEIDQIGAVKRLHLDEAKPIIAPGMAIHGRAKGCGGEPPAQLILLVNGVLLGATQEFSPRPDSSMEWPSEAPSGWSIKADTRPVALGEQILQVAVRVQPHGDFRIVREQPVIVAPAQPDPSPAEVSPASLIQMAARAAAFLKERQSPDGYWLTAFTSGLQFEKPRMEMNTFLTAMMVDFLLPIEGRHGLTESITRARHHLAAQIESDGLVRYHGLPTGPTIGKLGVVITPDSDDTALAWRLKGPDSDNQRPDQMLKALAAYRDSRDLYRTWLAPREKFRSIDPGDDPNPVDATIQMHIFMMLRGINPPAAQELCGAMQRAISNDALWVYYAKAPLIPYLRSVQLAGQGCALPSVADRLQGCAKGQEIWCELARRLVAAEASPPGASDRQALWTLLARLGGNSFAELRRTPPLLYHNDLTATVSRFYWSEDFGYALWLRAYEAALSGVSEAGEPGR